MAVGCTMPANRTQSGASASNNCEGGCNVRFPTAQSFGPNFNQNGGGWFALERRTNFIKMWFWHRKAGNVPAFISNPTEKLNTDGWVSISLRLPSSPSGVAVAKCVFNQGTPAAFFPNTTCDMTKYFTDHHLIINLTFCTSPVDLLCNPLLRLALLSIHSDLPSTGGDWAGPAYASSGCPSTCAGTSWSQVTYVGGSDDPPSCPQISSTRTQITSRTHTLISPQCASISRRDELLRLENLC